MLRFPHTYRFVPVLGLALSSAIVAAGEQCSTTQTGVVCPGAGTAMPADACPPTRCERMRTLLRRMSWRHSTSHAHFMYDSCPPLWSPCFGYYETGWRKGEACACPCPTTSHCPPGANIVPVEPQSQMIEQPTLETAPATPQPPGIEYLPPVEPMPPVKPVPMRSAEPVPMPIPALAPPKAETTFISPPVRTVPSAATTPPQELQAVSSQAALSARTTPPRSARRMTTSSEQKSSSILLTALSETVTNDIFPEGSAQTDAFPLRSRSVPRIATAPVDVPEKLNIQIIEKQVPSEPGRDAVQQPNAGEPSIRPLGLATTTGLLVKKSTEQRR